MNRTRLYKLLLVILLIVSASVVHAAPRQILLHVQQPELAYSEPVLERLIMVELSRNYDLRVISSATLGDQMPAFPKALYDVDSLIDFGREVGSRYLMQVVVDKERLETRSAFGIPLILKRYKRVGVIEGEFRIYDLQRGRLLLAEPFSKQIKAASATQIQPDDNPHVASLRIPASEKEQLFTKLEQSLAKELVKKVFKKLRSK